jgi:hypothetical protein
MRIAIDVELSETVEPGRIVERRRFSRVVEMELPEIGHEIELNVSAEPVIVNVVSIRHDAGDDLYHILVSSHSLRFASLRQDERWTDTLL